MNRNLVFLVILAFLPFYGLAQDIQWAASVKRFSTEYSRTAYSAKQVLGKPDKLPATGESPVAWAPSSMDNPNGEFIHVTFERPMRIRQVVVGESNNPGAIAAIILFDTGGKKHSVYEHKHGAAAIKSGGGLWHTIFELTDYEVKEVKVVLNTRAVAGMNQIDCIGISQSETPYTLDIASVAQDVALPPAENLGPLVNSRADDMLPLVSPDGTTLYFARKRHPENVGEEKRDDIWFSSLQADGSWGPAQHLDAPLNNEFHNYVAWVSPDGNTLLLANDYSNPGIGQRVSVSQRTGNQWSFPQTLAVNDMYNRNEFSCYHMNTEGNVLLLAIERGDTKGDMDIYVSFKRPNNAWTKPMNIGSDVNTAGTEGSIFLAADNRTIYFASNGHSGFGGFDMFMSKRLDDTWTNWSEPLNMGVAINSIYDDFYYTIPASGDYLYFSSRQETYGGADLFRIPLPKELQPDPIALFKGKVFDKETGEPVMAEISYGGLISGDPIATTIITGSDIQLIVPGNDYEITYKTPGYLPVYDRLNIDEQYADIDYNATDPIQVYRHTIRQELIPRIQEKSHNREELIETIQSTIDSIEADELDSEAKESLVNELTLELLQEPTNNYQEIEDSIYMVPIREGQILTMDNVFFDANKSTIREASYDQLNEILAFLRDNPNIYVEVGGHTNGLPEAEFCFRLSSDRAEKVANYFIKQGIPADRISWKGYGKTQPIADNNTLAGRKKNQRVELKIIRVE